LSRSHPWDFGIMSEFKAYTDMISRSQGIKGSESPDGKSLTACLTSSFGLEKYYFMEREFGRMPVFEAQDIKIKSSLLYIKNYKAEVMASHRNCRTAYADKGLLAIPYLLRDAIAGNGCEWEPEIEEIK
jgi:hypothetical protein